MARRMGGLNTPSQHDWLESIRGAVRKNSLGIRSPKGKKSGIWIKSSPPTKKMYQTQHRWISCYGRECRWWYPEKELRSIWFSSFYHNGTNMMAETRALRDGFKLCSDKGIQVNDIESYSKVMVDSILGLISTPWHVLYLIRECIGLLSSGMMVSHIYRQGNSIADRLASHAYSHRSDCIVEAASSLLQTSLLQWQGRPLLLFLFPECFLSSKSRKK